MSKTTYYRHREEFFDPISNVWSLSNHKTDQSPPSTVPVSQVPDGDEYSMLESPEYNGPDICMSLDGNSTEGNLSNNIYVASPLVYS